MRFVPVMALAVSLSACMPQRSNSEDGGAVDPNASVAPLGYQSVTAGVADVQPVEPLSWAAQNRLVAPRMKGE